MRKGSLVNRQKNRETLRLSLLKYVHTFKAMLEGSYQKTLGIYSNLQNLEDIRGNFPSKTKTQTNNN